MLYMALDATGFASIPKTKQSKLIIY